MDIFKLLKEILSNSRELTSRHLKELALMDNELDLEESEEQINSLITPLSNVIRLKLLKNLSKGGKYYSQLEHLLGIRAGHLLFHIERLKEVDYIVQEEKKYMITLKGRKIMAFLSVLRKEVDLL